MNIICYPLPPGARWCEDTKKMIIREECIAEDEVLPDDRRTMVEMRRMGNTICPIK